MTELEDTGTIVSSGIERGEGYVKIHYAAGTHSLGRFANRPYGVAWLTGRCTAVDDGLSRDVGGGTGGGPWLSL